jgi:hypothetical protein
MSSPLVRTPVHGTLLVRNLHRGAKVGAAMPTILARCSGIAPTLDRADENSTQLVELR